MVGKYKCTNELMTREYFTLQSQTNRGRHASGPACCVRPETTVKTIRSEPWWLSHRLATKKLDILEASEAWQPAASEEAVVKLQHI